MKDLYSVLVYDEISSIFHDWCKNNGTPLLRTVWYNNRKFEPNQDEWKADRKLVGYSAQGDCCVEDPDKTGWHSLKFEWERDSNWLTLFNCNHLEYYRLITMKEGTPIIVAFPDKKEAYKATFVSHKMGVGYGHYVYVKKTENGEEVLLHGYSYEGDWICFPAE